MNKYKLSRVRFINKEIIKLFYFIKLYTNKDIWLNKLYIFYLVQNTYYMFYK